MNDPNCGKCGGDGLYYEVVEEWATVTCDCGNDPECEECEGSGTYTEWQMRQEERTCDCRDPDTDY